MIKILHLSDIHIKSVQDFRKSFCDEILKSIDCREQIELFFIVLSGDITYSGTKSQFEVAEQFIIYIKSEIQNKLCIKSEQIRILIVPGNHDIDLSTNIYDKSDLESFQRTRSYDEFVELELEKLVNYSDFANRVSENCNSDFLSREIVEIDNIKIRFTMLNTAFFSLKLDSDNGLHYLPNTTLDQLKIERNGTIEVLIMHHPSNWFNNSMRNELEDIISKNYDIILVGHEHYSSNELRKNGDNFPFIFIKSEVLVDDGDWSKGGFNVLTLDITKKKIKLVNFKYDLKYSKYTINENLDFNLERHVNNSFNLKFNKDFYSSFELNNKSVDKSSYKDSFVFPELELDKENGKFEITNFPIVSSFDQFNELVTLNKLIAIGGNTNSGKTFISKFLFEEFYKSKIVLWFNINELKNAKYDLFIKHIFESIYGTKSNDFTSFDRAENEDKLIIIDDINTYEDISELSDFLNYIYSNFGYVIFTYQSDNVFDIVKNATFKSLASKFVFYKIQPFYGAKRKELVKKTIENYPIIRMSEKDELINSVIDSLKVQKSFFSYEPDFITMFTKYLCQNYGTGNSTSADRNIYSFVFESNLTSYLKKYVDDMYIGQYYMILSEIATYIYDQNNNYSISINDILILIDKYNSKFDNSISKDKFQNVIINKSKILIEIEMDQYSFKNTEYFAYFVARNINYYYKRNDNNARLRLQKVLKLSFLETNSSILLFLTYINQNTELLNLLIDQMETFVNGWNEFEFERINENFPYLRNNPVKIKEFSAINESSKKEYRDEQINKERENAKNTEKKQIGTVYVEDEKITAMNEISRAASLLNTISKSLPSFSDILDKDEKERIVKVLYTTPNKIYFRFAGLVQNNIDKYLNIFSFLMFVKENLKDFQYIKFEYDEEKYKKYNPKAQNIIVDMSLDVYLEILASVAISSSRKNTIKSLLKFDYQSKDTYKLSALLMLENIKSSKSKFIDLSRNILQESKNTHAKIIARRTMYHYLINNEELSSKEIIDCYNEFFGNSQTSKYFKSNNELKKLTIKRMKYMSKKK